MHDSLLIRGPATAWLVITARTRVRMRVVPDKDISPRTRKRLWLRSGGTCAYPGCPVELLEADPGRW